MAGISSPGIGSGLDVNSIVTKLVSIESQPLADLQTKASAIQTQLSSFGVLQSYASKIHDTADKLAQTSFWTSTAATSSDTTSVGVSASTTAAAGSYQVNVTQLAQGQNLSSKAYASSSTSVGTGTLHIQLGSWDSPPTTFTPDPSKTTVDIAVAAGQDSLSSIQSAINAANAGVTASIVTDNSGARLVLTSNNTGAQSAVRITATDDDGNNTDASGLSALAFDPATSGGQMTQNQAAKDASATINGLTVTSSTNTLSNVLSGVTLTLSKQTTSPVLISVAVDTASIKKAISDFAQAYSSMNAYIAQQTKYDPSTKQAAPLQGDATTSMLQSNVRSLFVSSSNASLVYSRLSDIGLEIQTDGSMKVNDAKLSAALAANPAEVAKMFDSTASADPSQQGFAVRARDLAGALTDVSGSITAHTQSLRDAIKRNQDDQLKMEDRIALIQDRLTKQYSALDTLMSQMNTTNSSLTQSLTALANQSAAISKG